METKKFLRLSRQDYGLFAAKICFKPQKQAFKQPKVARSYWLTIRGAGNSQRASDAIITEPFGPQTLL